MLSWPWLTMHTNTYLTNKTMQVTITIDATSERQLTDSLMKLATNISDTDTGSYELMDGSYQIEEANVEIQP
jgi:hypothetical protein